MPGSRLNERSTLAWIEWTETRDDCAKTGIWRIRWNLFDARRQKTRDVPSKWYDKRYERFFQRVNAFRGSPGLSLIVRDANSFAENSESCRIDPIGIPSVKSFLRETGIYRIERSSSAVIGFYSTNLSLSLSLSLFRFPSLCLTIRLNLSTPGQKQTFPSNQLFPFAI